jgi:hypothetical protein
LSVENTTNFTPESLDSIKKKESESEWKICYNTRKRK